MAGAKTALHRMVSLLSRTRGHADRAEAASQTPQPDQPNIPAIVSRDIRAPLTGIKAFAETLPDGAPLGRAPLEELPPTLACRVLLVEDWFENQRVLSYLLHDAGATVTAADNGRLGVNEALAAEDNHDPFQIVLMDMQMPVMDGYKATALLRSCGYARPIIAITAHAMAHDREKCLAAGCDDYAAKPIDRGALIEMVRRWVPAPTVARGR